MADSIKFLQFFQKFHRILGIYPSQQNQKPRSINSINVILLIFFVQMILTTAAFLLFEANSILDYGFASFMLSTLIMSIVNYSIFIWQAENTFKFIGHCEGFIEKSK